MTESPPEVTPILDRLRALDRSQPAIDHDQVERALAEHLHVLGLAPLSLRWVPDAEAGYVYARRAGENAQWVGRVSMREDDLPPETAYCATRARAWITTWTEADWTAVKIAEQAASSKASGHLRIRWGPAQPVARGVARALALMSLMPGTTTSASSRALARHVSVWRPFIDACVAGLWLFWPLHGEVILVPRPAIKVSAGRLHCDDGPAVWWPNAARYYFWRGLHVRERMILRPETIRADEIVAEPNAEVQQMMLERVGYARFLQEVGARPVRSDDFGMLYRVALPGAETLALVQVENSTPEPEGSFKSYFLRVPPAMKTPREAVAWTFGMAAHEYEPRSET